jgi:hypothetical protein
MPCMCPIHRFFFRKIPLNHKMICREHFFLEKGSHWHIG